VSDDNCVFCGPEWYRAAELVFETDNCIYASTRDPADPTDVLPWCGVIVPRAHRPSPFHLTSEEWAATHELLLKVRSALHERVAPDGYLLGWNDFPPPGQAPTHAHLHVVPRFDDEPRWDHGVRSAIKVADNVRPQPAGAGSGRAMHH
jgi:diadenosine tetraphosphate (Ap4A) HIT family hydrolase